MPHLDRDSLIALLTALGDADDARALDAAREIDRRVREAETDWDSLLRPPPGALPAEDEPTDDAPAPAEAESPPDMVETAADLALIERMLAELPLSDETREELAEMRTAIAEGRHSRMDSRYLRGLSARLTARQPA
jgi:hypothetical protein